MCPEVPITAVTATATKRVVDEIKQVLKIWDPVEVRVPLNWENHWYHKTYIKFLSGMDVVNIIKKSHEK